MFKAYLADGVKAVCENTAIMDGAYGAKGQALGKRFIEILLGVEPEEVNGDEIVKNVIKNAGLEVIQ